MRKRRAIVYDDDPVIRSVLTRILERRGYDVVAAPEPEICTIYVNVPSCDKLAPCSDLLLTDNRMPRMTGLELLKAQTERGCALSNRNKALLSGDLNESSREQVRALGCEFFDKPLDLDHLQTWLKQCEHRMDLSVPLGSRRRTEREGCSLPATCRTEVGGVLFGAEVVNRSERGVCIRIDSPPAALQVVRMESGPRFPSGRFLVRWMKDISGGRYLVGMSCD